MAEFRLLIAICLCLWAREIKATNTQDPSVCENPVQRTLCGGTSFDVHKCSLKNGDGAILYINLKEEDEGTACTFYDGVPEDVSTDEGRWGIDETILWTKGNCRGVFEFCTAEPFCKDGRILDVKYCYSDGGYHVCEGLNDEPLIIGAEVVNRAKFDKTCNFWSGNYMSFRNLLYTFTSSDILQREGSFGYYGSHIWMDLGCQADYRVCVEDMAVCRAPKRVGPCDDEIPKFYYNQTSGQCEQFIWSGCRANKNNFETHSDCESACLNQEIDECVAAPCRSGGTCINTPNSYHCECLNNGWSGKHCDDSVCKGRLQTVECANPNHDSSDLHECKVHSDSFSLISVRLTEELDDTSCTFYDGPHQDVSTDQSRWGFTSDAIWVKGYCHGNFEYCSTENADCDPGFCGEHGICYINQDTPYCKCFAGFKGDRCEEAPPCTDQMQTVQCYSGLDPHNITYCEVGAPDSSIISMRVVHVQWDPPCNFKTDINYERVMEEDGGYGYNDNSNIMWSSDGCTGTFEYCLKLPHCPGEVKTVDCQSWYDDEYVECPVTNDSRKIVYASVKERYSEGVYCNYRKNFNSEERFKFGQTGFTDNKVWVYDECRAKIEVCLSANECRPLKRKPDC